MRFKCNSGLYVRISLAVFLATGQIAMAGAENTSPGVTEFARCSRQCAQENTQCLQTLETRCKPADLDCLESCDLAYPACMAKCPKPADR